MFHDGLTQVSLVCRVIEALFKFIIYSECCVLSEGLPENILGLNVGDETLIAWNILSFDVLGGSTYPVGTLS
jgi:hypothetical protein